MNKAKPNIIFICADQWRGDCLGFYKNQHPVMTPHLNQLAREGRNYPSAYADCPICMPQRLTMLTGRTGSSLGVISNFMSGPRPDIDEHTTISAILGAAGYHTQAVGKMHFYPDRARWGFDNVVLHPNDYVNFLEENGYGGAYRGHGLGGNEVYPGVFPAPEKYYHTNWIVEESIRFLDRRDPDRPFFLSVVFEAPHSPFDPPAPYDRFYDNFSIPEPAVSEWSRSGDCPCEFISRTLSGNYDDLSPEAILEARRKYYGQITNIDYQLGRLFGALKTRGLDDNTTIVFTSDHGELLGDHGVFAKYCFLEGAARVPLIIRPAVSTGLKLPDLNGPVMTADIVPTLLETAGIACPEQADGRSLLNEDSWDRIICGETAGSAFAVDSEYKYIYYVNGGVEQLFKPENDPDDMHNLINQPGIVDAHIRLKTALISYLGKYGSDKIDNGSPVRKDEAINEEWFRKNNPAACRGPMRFGSGY